MNDVDVLTGKGTSLIGARPELTRAYDALTQIADVAGITFCVANYGGLRSQADTALIKQIRIDEYNAAVQRNPATALTDINDWRPIADWGSSMHNYGAAFDVFVTGTPPTMSRLTALNFLKDQADAIGLVDGRNFGDAPHFELPGGLSLAKAEWQKMTGTAFFRH